MRKRSPHPPVRHVLQAGGFLAFCLAAALVLFPLAGQTVSAPAGELTLPAQSGEAAAAMSSIGSRLIPLGRTTGIKLFSPGAMVVGFSQLEPQGTCPAREGGLRTGDILVALNGQPISSNEALTGTLSRLDSEKAVFTVLRQGQEQLITVTAAYDGELDCYRIGAWVRDSVAGIGTITFVDPETGAFGALGHGICDADTGELIRLGTGSVMASQVTRVDKSSAGTPGQLCGSFDLTRDQGTLWTNNPCGIFGTLSREELYAGAQAVETAPRGALHTGEATIISNISGTEAREYSARILRVYAGASGGRELMLEVTDPDLLSETGGIVQGMSGSPILQDGKLVGAVTHVLVNSPHRGYGISIETMLSGAAE